MKFVILNGFFLILFCCNLSYGIDLDGSLEYKNFFCFDKANNNKIRNEGILKIELEGNIGHKGRYFVVPKIYIDDNSLSAGIIDGIKDNDLKRNILTLEEILIKFKFRYFDFSLGKQIYSWGKADNYNPTDNLNPQDYMDPLDNEKIGIVSFKGNYYTPNYTLEFIIIPFFTPSRLPLPHSRWSFIPTDFPLPINERNLPKDSIKNIQVALKYSTSVNGWDFSTSYYNGFDDIWVGVITPTGITPIYDKIRVLGGSFSTCDRKVEIHGESGIFIRDNKDLSSYIQNIIGVNYRWENIVSTHNLHLTMEYLKKSIIDRGNDSIILDIDPSMVFKDSLLGKICYELEYFKKFEIAGVINLSRDHDFCIRPKFIYKVTDNFDIEIGIDILQGSLNSLWEKFSNNDRFFLRTVYNFGSSPN